MVYLKQFSYQGVRNLKPGRINLSPGLNIFEGTNGAGKSSILEAISLGTSGRSFRTNKLDLVTAENSDEFFVNSKFEPIKSVGFSHSNKKKINRLKIDNENIQSLSKLSGIYPTQVLCPESYHLIDSGPAERRKYLDWLLFHVEHSFMNAWKDYSQLHKQRNALLRSGRRADVFNQLKVWDKQYIKAAVVLNDAREKVLHDLSLIVSQIIYDLKIDFCEGIRISYYPGYRDKLEDRLTESLNSDIEKGYTQFGPHKSDVRIKIGTTLARDLLSRGQKKVLINALFIAQTVLLKRKTDKDSLFIIDDFTSELDINNQKALLSMLMRQKNTQIIISCLQLEALKWLEKGYNKANMFHVEQGQISVIDPVETNE